MTRFDYVIVGGGLQGGLIALAVRHYQPSATVALVERGGRLGGNHTWSFHARDLPADAAGFVEPLVSARWPSYLVGFPGFGRVIHSPYASILSDQFADVVQSALDGPGHRVWTAASAAMVAADRVEMADGATLEGACVIDARGPARAMPAGGRGYQKFLGLEVETDRPWPDDRPTLMDARVPQDDGYRFIYALPFGRRRVLVEDSYFSDTPALNLARMRERVSEYLEARGVGRFAVLREESGVLPMPWSGGGVLTPDDSGPILGGYAGGWFHPATGYSFPMAVRLALTIARSKPEETRHAIATLAGRARWRQRFARFLNLLLFRVVVPEQRWQVFRRLYRDMPDAVMARFYAMEFTPYDAARMLMGWPPPLAPLRMLKDVEDRSCMVPSY